LSTTALGTAFGGITDIETGPDGLLYVLTLDREADGEGKIYRITQKLWGCNKIDKIQVMEVWTVITKDNDDEKDELKDHVNKAYSIRYESIPMEFPIYLNTDNNT
jgi:hypothetical protein